MGCASSRFDKRNNNAGDLNTVGLQFVGGESHAFDGCPVDKIAWVYDKTKENSDKFAVGADLAATSEEAIKAIYKTVWVNLNAKLKALKDKHGNVADGKTVWIDGKYSSKDAIAQLEAAVAFLKEKSGITVEEATPMGMEAKAGDMMMMEAPAGEMMMEGGDEMMAGMMMGMMEGMALPNPHKYEGDAYDYAGWAKVPAAFLRNMIVNPYWGDLVKAQVVGWEFNPEKGPKDSGFDLTFGAANLATGLVGVGGGKNMEWAGAAGLVGAAVSAGSTDGQSFFLSGHLGNDDFESLKALSAEAGDKKIHFPFLTYGWATKDEALQALALASTQGKQTYHKIVIEVTGAKALKFVDCRFVAHRLNGAITAGAAAEGINHYTLAATALPEKTHADWLKEVAAAAASKAAPVVAPAEGGMMMDAAPMMEPPAEGM